MPKAPVLTEEQKELKRQEREQRRDDVMAQIYDVEINIKKVDDVLTYLSSAYNIDLSKPQELIKQLRDELHLT